MYQILVPLVTTMIHTQVFTTKYQESVESVSRDGPDTPIICNTLHMTQLLRIGILQILYFHTVL